MTSENDSRVSEAYREASGEKVPEHLNRAILDEAKRASRPRYARSRAWTRPLAWAATIALSVAIVLELTQVEEMDGLMDDFAAPAVKEADEAELERQDMPAEALEESLPSSPQRAKFRAEPVKSEADSAGRMQKSPDTPARISAEDFEPQDKNLLQDAEEAAELRHAEPKASAPAMLRSMAAPSCPDDARRDPKSWMACIERLEEAGLHEEAELQRRQLAEAFPDFELP
jgi:hypothetical protein